MRQTGRGSREGPGMDHGEEKQLKDVRRETETRNTIGEHRKKERYSTEGSDRKRDGAGREGSIDKDRQ